MYLRGCYIHGELSTQATATERRKVAGTWRDLERRWWTVQVDKKVGPFFFEVSSWWLSFNPVLPPVMFGVKIPSKYFRKLQREVSNLTSLVALFLTLIHAFHLGVPWYHSSTWIESINQWIPWVFSSWIESQKSPTLFLFHQLNAYLKDQTGKPPGFIFRLVLSYKVPSKIPYKIATSQSCHIVVISVFFSECQTYEIGGEVVFV